MQVKVVDPSSGGRQKHSDDKDVNEVSGRYGKVCGNGAYFTEDPQQAADYSAFKNGKMEGYTCMFEVRLKPVKTRIPEKELAYRIVNEPQYARPTGICVFVGNSKLKQFGWVNRAKIDLKSNRTLFSEILSLILKMQNTRPNGRSADSSFAQSLANT